MSRPTSCHAAEARDLRAQQGLRPAGLADQIDLRADGTPFVDVADLPADRRYVRYQETVNAGGAPSEPVIEEYRAKSGHEHRDETDGEHPSWTCDPSSPADEELPHAHNSSPPLPRAPDPCPRR